jgi:glutamyl-tRNA synthetase
MQIEEVARKYALINAVTHKGKADLKAVLAKVFGEVPEARKDIKNVIEIVKKIIAEVNSLSFEKQRDLVKELGIEIEKKEKKAELPPLPQAEKVVMRIAPSPNGPLHIGHARMVILNDEYVKRYKGKLILRFDDTDPKNPNKIPLKEAYEMIKEDLRWLQVKWHSEIYASKRLKIYYQYFEECLRRGFGYVCKCEPEKWRERVRAARKPCPCRENSIEKNLDEWEKMLEGIYREGEAVARIKTDLTQKDPATIDWVAFRIVDNPRHPLFEAPPKIWPSLDFASSIDDFECGVTHIIRGKDLAICEKRQKTLYELFGWKYPWVAVFGKIFSEEVVLSTSEIRKGIESGKFSGWDDPRLPTLLALKKRGIQPEAVRKYITSLGLTEHETNLDLNILFAENRKIVDARAKRFFLVVEPIEIKLDKVPVKEVYAPLYPQKEKRRIEVSEKIFVEKSDFEKFRGKEVRLMHFCNIVLEKEARVTSIEKKDLPKLHWVSKPIEVKLIYPEHIVNALGEKNIESVNREEIVQFERIGFARCEEPKVFYFSHK